jgi:hypothetical protein
VLEEEYFYHPGKFMSPPMINIALFIVLALVTDVSCRLSNVIDSIKPDIIIGTETWRDKDIKDSEICPKGYILHRKDRNSKNHRTGVF